jgi:hypothetical protein
MAPRFLSEGDWSFVIILAGSFLAAVWRFMTGKFHETRARLMNEEHERAEQLAEERRPYLGAAQVEVEKLLNPWWTAPPLPPRQPSLSDIDPVMNAYVDRYFPNPMKKVLRTLGKKGNFHSFPQEGCGLCTLAACIDAAQQAKNAGQLANDAAWWASNGSQAANRKPS